MERKSYESEGLYRFKIIAPLVGEVFAKGELRKKIHAIAGQFYEHPARGWEKFAFKTVEEWYYDYRRYGMRGLERGRRRDHGKSRSIGDEAGELILTMKKENPHRSALQIIRELLMAGKIRPGEIRRSSVYRFLSRHRYEINLHKKGGSEKKKFAFAGSNECWQSDVCHGPYLFIEGYRKKKRIFLFGILDDASRIIPHAGIFLSENLENFLEVLKTALLKKGIPLRFYLDNASYFRSPILQKIGARLGIKISYCTPYSPYKKGKIERFWRTCTEQFLSSLERNRKYTLDELNRLFLTWIEKYYHHSLHSSLGKTPIEAWQEKARNIRYPDVESLDVDFLAEVERKVRKDGTFSLNGVYYEVDSIMAGETVTVRYNPFNRGKVYVYYQGK
jgi:transposase InsO family protein